MKNHKIKPSPCPFCGCRFVSVMELKYEQIRVACGLCLAEMTGGYTRSAMVKQWNKRASK